MKSQKALEKLIQSKDAEIKKLTLNIEKLETDIKDIQEVTRKLPIELSNYSDVLSNSILKRLNQCNDVHKVNI